MALGFYLMFIALVVLVVCLLNLRDAYRYHRREQAREEHWKSSLPVTQKDVDK